MTMIGGAQLTLYLRVILFYRHEQEGNQESDSYLLTRLFLY